MSVAMIIRTKCPLLLRSDAGGTIYRTAEGARSNDCRGEQGTQDTHRGHTGYTQRAHRGEGTHRVHTEYEQ